MPVVPHSDLPAFERLRTEGVEVAPPEPSLPNLHIGLLNLMPDAALAATDRQFVRLVSGYQAAANLYVHPFSVDSGHRGPEARDYVADHYLDFEELIDVSPDALIITGANPTHFELSDEPFWDGLTKVIDWADTEVLSTLCSCLATHAVLEHHGVLKRSKLPEKRWGVYQHANVAVDHPLLSGLGAPVEAPHSHWFDMTRGELEKAGIPVLIHGDESGVHMATSEDGFRYVFFQGHPEYEDISLLKEYKREVMRFTRGERDYPPFPDHYFDESARSVLDEYRRSLGSKSEPPAFPEREVTRRWRPTWFDEGRQIYSNWLTEVALKVAP